MNAPDVLLTPATVVLATNKLNVMIVSLPCFFKALLVNLNAILNSPTMPQQLLPALLAPKIAPNAQALLKLIVLNVSTTFIS